MIGLLLLFCCSSGTNNSDNLCAIILSERMDNHKHNFAERFSQQYPSVFVFRMFIVVLV